MPIPAIIIIGASILMPFIWVYLWAWLINRLYRSFHVDSAGIPDAAKLNYNTPRLSAYFAARAIVQDAHTLAKEKQSEFHSAMSFGVGCLFTASLLFSFAISYPYTSKSLFKALYSCEVALMLASVLAYSAARQKKKVWLNHRVAAELIRRWLWNTILLSRDDQNRSNAAQACEIRYVSFLTEIENLSETQIAQLIQDNFDSELIGLAIISGDTTQNMEAIEFYKVFRMDRQVKWFDMSAKRVKHFLHLRERCLLWAFWLTFAFAIAKALGYWVGLMPEFETLKELLSFLSLLAISVTLATTAIMLNQGTNALEIRYLEQAHAVKNAADEFEGHLRNPVKRIKNFESLMHSELIFFVNSMRGSTIETAL